MQGRYIRGHRVGPQADLSASAGLVERGGVDRGIYVCVGPAPAEQRERSAMSMF